MSTNKLSEFDLITAWKQHPNKAMRKLTYSIDVVIRQKYIPNLWKCSEVKNLHVCNVVTPNHIETFVELGPPLFLLYTNDIKHCCCGWGQQYRKLYTFQKVINRLNSPGIGIFITFQSYKGNTSIVRHESW